MQADTHTHEIAKPKSKQIFFKVNDMTELSVKFCVRYFGKYDESVLPFIQILKSKLRSNMSDG